MWSKTYHKIFPDVKKENIWRLWTDVNNWYKWDKDIDHCEMRAPFTAGSHFILKPTKGPMVKIFLSEVINDKKFVTYTRFPGAIMHDLHELEETANGLRITSTITVQGILSFIWVHLIAKSIFNEVPERIDALVKFATYDD